MPYINITNIIISDNKAKFFYYNSLINTFILYKKILIDLFNHNSILAHTFSPRTHSGYSTCGIRAYASVLVRTVVHYLSIKRNTKPFQIMFHKDEITRLWHVHCIVCSICRERDNSSGIRDDPCEISLVVNVVINHKIPFVSELRKNYISKNF